ncbi:hypothetical protein PFISCL1PPCAC_15531, partial [Pristionchus fissidentatus]
VKTLTTICLIIPYIRAFSHSVKNGSGFSALPFSFYRFTPSLFSLLLLHNSTLFHRVHYAIPSQPVTKLWRSKPVIRESSPTNQTTAGSNLRSNSKRRLAVDHRRDQEYERQREERQRAEGAGRQDGGRRWSFESPSSPGRRFSNRRYSLLRNHDLHLIPTRNFPSLSITSSIPFTSFYTNGMTIRHSKWKCPLKPANDP